MWTPSQGQVPGPPQQPQQYPPQQPPTYPPPTYPPSAYPPQQAPIQSQGYGQNNRNYYGGPPAPPPTIVMATTHYPVGIGYHPNVPHGPPPPEKKFCGCLLFKYFIILMIILALILIIVVIIVLCVVLIIPKSKHRGIRTTDLDWGGKPLNLNVSEGLICYCNSRPECVPGSSTVVCPIGDRCLTRTHWSNKNKFPPFGTTTTTTTSQPTTLKTSPITMGTTKSITSTKVTIMTTMMVVGMSGKHKNNSELPSNTRYYYPHFHYPNRRPSYSFSSSPQEYDYTDKDYRGCVSKLARGQHLEPIPFNKGCRYTATDKSYMDNACYCTSSLCNVDNACRCGAHNLKIMAGYVLTSATIFWVHFF